MNRVGIWVVALLIVLAAGSSLLYTVDERRYGVVYQLSEIQHVEEEPGLHFKLLPAPFQTVDYLDKRLLTLHSPTIEPTLTAEKQWVVIDWYVRWRIHDPAAYIRAVGRNEAAGAAQLARVVRSTFQEEVNRRTVRQLLNEPDRLALMQTVQREVARSVGSPIDEPVVVVADEASLTTPPSELGTLDPDTGERVVSQTDGQTAAGAAHDPDLPPMPAGASAPVDPGLSWGITIVDVRITRVDYSRDITEAVFNRMRAERESEARLVRAQGQAAGEQIRANADRQRIEKRANAYREAQQIRAQGDSEATRIFAEAYGKDGDFAQFYRSLLAYRNSIGQPGDVLVLNPSESEFFRAMRSQPATASPAPQRQ
ncbi:hypothetical protein AAV94_07360 [Lampropedia cohaerens]|uniref:Protein HflC n=1 Tax=Lampropedia cohaerens TaxID=1610491 RepID=A0A0U1PZP2_9BURK|nr:protease modulator HflC [Lampropedia cohaerens]KKW67980.1 hypothetical protein AAV94_07360 [Lampropedia cohaerens]